MSERDRDRLVRSPFARPGAPSARSADLRDVEDLVRERGLSLGLPFHVEAEATSTNDLAKSAAREGAPHGSVWLAESQTAGRGRQGRAWGSPRGENLLFSVLLRPDAAMPLARLPELSLVVGLAVRDAAAKALGEGTSRPLPRLAVKWPNDVVAIGEVEVDGAGEAAPRRRKLAGVLLESQITGSGARAKVEALIVGVGLNVHTRLFPGELARTATSLALLGASADRLARAAVLVDVLEGLHRDLTFVAERGLGLVHARLTAADALRGERVFAEGASGPCQGTGEGIDLEGRLMVRGDDGVLRRISSGEVHLGAG